MGELSADGAVNHSSVFPWPGGRAASQHRHSQPRRGGEAWLSLNTNVSRAAAALRPAPQAGRGPGETPQAAHHQGLPLQCWQPGGLQNEPAALARTTECWPCLAACPRGRLSLGISVCPWGWLFVSLFASCGEAGEPCRAPGRETRARGVSVPGGPRCPDCCWQPCLSAHPLPCLPRARRARQRVAGAGLSLAACGQPRAVVQRRAGSWQGAGRELLAPQPCAPIPPAQTAQASVALTPPPLAGWPSRATCARRPLTAGTATARLGTLSPCWAHARG